MITSIRFCLKIRPVYATLSPSKFVYFNESLHYCIGRLYAVNCSRLKSYVTGGHHIIYDIKLSTDITVIQFREWVNIRVLNNIYSKFRFYNPNYILTLTLKFILFERIKLFSLRRTFLNIPRLNIKIISQ